MYNPGAAGISNKDMIGISFRSMWSSFPGNPRTYMVYGDANLEKLKAGMGAYVYRDETGPTSRTGIQLAFSKHIISQDGKNKLGLGLEVRGLQYAIDKSKLGGSLGSDPALAGAENKIAFDAGAGAYFTNGKLSVGAAVSQIVQSKLQLADVPNSTQGGKLYRHYNFNANYKIHTGDNIYLIPNALVRVIENSPSEYEFGMNVNYQEKIWWGLNWRINQLWSIQAGFKILKRVGLTYSYDYYQSPISNFTEGSGAHELGLRFDLKRDN
jgi:type IX secretion system PorP/SprF family membrane protein